MFYTKVKDINTGRFYQLKTLKDNGLIDPEFRKVDDNITYPVTIVTRITRYRTRDKQEFLYSNKLITAINRYGNELTLPIDSPEVWERPLWNFRSVPQPEGQKAIGIVDGIQRKITEYDLKFTPQEAQRLWDMRDPDPRNPYNKCGLLIKDEHHSQPFGIDNFEDFKNKKFQELWDSIVMNPKRFDPDENRHIT
jgi:hypothetical protein